MEKDTALIQAAQAGSLDSVQALLEARADTNLADQFGRTPLNWAARYNMNNIVEALVRERRRRGRGWAL